MHCGALPDPDGCAIGAPIGKLLSGINAIADHTDLSWPSLEVPEQSYPSCYGHAWMNAISVATRGRVVCSPMAVWSMARWLDDTTQAIQEWGVVARSRWPDDVDPRAIVSQNVLEAASLAMVREVYRVDLDGYERVNAIKGALTRGHPVVFVTSIGSGYKGYTGGLYMGESSLNVVYEGHAQAIVGCDLDGVKVMGSWGKTWGEDGYARVAWSVIMSKYCMDFQVMELAPGIVA
jgi:hypothetical protein